MLSCGDSSTSFIVTIGWLRNFRRNQVFLHRFGNGASAAVDLELLVNATNVFISRVKADAELGGGFLDRVALHEQLQNVPLAWREAVILLRRMRAGKHFQNPARDAGIDRRAAGGGCA